MLLEYLIIDNVVILNLGFIKELEIIFPADVRRARKDLEGRWYVTKFLMPVWPENLYIIGASFVIY